MDYQLAPNGKREKEPERLQRLSELYQKMREAAEKATPQAIEVKILKNRNGKRKNTRLNFYPMFNYFAEPAGEQTEKPAQRRILEQTENPGRRA